MSVACTEGSLRTDRSPEKSEKNHTLTLEIIGLESKCQFFHFLLREIEILAQNQIKRIIFKYPIIWPLSLFLV